MKFCQIWSINHLKLKYILFFIKIKIKITIDFYKQTLETYIMIDAHEEPEVLHFSDWTEESKSSEGMPLPENPENPVN